MNLVRHQFKMTQRVGSLSVSEVNNLKAVGLVVEYNPFHNGHLYHLQKAKEVTGADVVVAVMSGNFTQRGEPTILDKWQRARAALNNGVDLVIELPLVSAVEPADRFAAGALQLLADMQVESVVFGAEHPHWDFHHMVDLEKSFQADQFKQFDQTYATQFNQQLKERIGVSLIDPNDILAFSYYKANINSRFGLRLVPIQRTGSQYHDQQIRGKVASASAIRNSVTNKQQELIQESVPEDTFEELVHFKMIPSWDQLYPLLRNQLIQAPQSLLAQTYQMSEGLENRLKRIAERELTFDGFIKRVKTKRYTYAHLTRLFLYTVLQASETEVHNAIYHPYHHLLGFTEMGQEYLHHVKKQLQYPLITKVDQTLHHGDFTLDYRAGKLYQMFTPDEQDIKRSPIRVTVK